VIQPQQIQVVASDTICVGQSTRLIASGADTYQWWPLHGLNNATVATPTAQPAVTTQYRVIGSDAYSCFSDTAFVTVVVGQQPIIDLGPDKQAASGTKILLTSNVVNGPIAQWIWSGNATSDLSCTTCAVPTLTVRTNASYTVRATTIYGCVATDTLHVKAFCTDAQVYIPNAFTPDGDGQNDVLMVRGTGIKLVKSFRIFNRWGQVVFERANFQANDVAQAWDGKLKGIPAPTDVYVYTCEVVCDNDTPFSYKGNITIIR
jgi:gliding motility-associated-like protein